MVPKGLFEGFGGIVRNPSQDSEGFLRIHLKIAEHVQGLALEILRNPQKILLELLRVFGSISVIEAKDSAPQRALEYLFKPQRIL